MAELVADHGEEHLMPARSQLPTKPDLDFRVPGYEILGHIGTGAIGDSYLGRPQRADLPAQVVVKRVHHHLLDEADYVVALIDAVRRAQRVQDPRIAANLEILRRRDELFFVGEHVSGLTLEQLVPGLAEPVPLGIAAALFNDLFAGLYASHSAAAGDAPAPALAHRGVSPRKIIVGLDGVTRLLGLGFACVPLPPSCDHGLVRGRVEHFAPEQALGDAVTPMADVYAASLVLWETVTGERFFPPSMSDVEIIRHIVDRAPYWQSRVEHRGVPALLVPLIERGLSRLAGDRGASAEEFATALERLGRATRAEVASWIARHLWLSGLDRSADD